MSDLGTGLYSKLEMTAAVVLDAEFDVPEMPAGALDVAKQIPGAVDVVARTPSTAYALAYEQLTSIRRVMSERASQDGRDDAEASAAHDPERGPHYGADVTDVTDVTDRASSAPAASAQPDERTQVFAAYGLTPQTPSTDSRGKRRQEERRRQREPEPSDEIEAQAKPGYTIDDIVQFAGVTVAERHSAPSLPTNLEKTGLVPVI